jgi:hypothetical protein
MKDVQNFVLYTLNSYDLILDPWNVCVCARAHACACASTFVLSNVSWVINIKLQVIIMLL